MYWWTQSIKVSVYRKLTHQVILHYTSYHPYSTKQGTVKCLENRATAMCTNEDSFKKEQVH